MASVGDGEVNAGDERSCDWVLPTFAFLHCRRRDNSGVDVLPRLFSESGDDLGGSMQVSLHDRKGKARKVGTCGDPTDQLDASCPA